MVLRRLKKMFPRIVGEKKSQQPEIRSETESEKEKELWREAKKTKPYREGSEEKKEAA